MRRFRDSTLFPAGSCGRIQAVKAGKRRGRKGRLAVLHLHNLYEASRYGAVILPPMQTYYNHPATPEDMARHTAARILGQFGLDTDTAEWRGMPE